MRKAHGEVAQEEEHIRSDQDVRSALKSVEKIQKEEGQIEKKAVHKAEVGRKKGEGKESQGSENGDDTKPLRKRRIRLFRATLRRAKREGGRIFFAASALDKA